jgi:hypothetical protein
MKNLAGGSGCGCGCLGLLVMLIGGIALAGIPLEVYDETGTSSAILVGAASLGSGVLVLVVGLVVWVISWFLE